jgi:16S rRNA (adenine1518-N6/adenine1519-N6)-dimethyltransferase
VSVLSNLPYHLSSAILFKLLEEKDRVARLVLTFQKEFAARLTAEPRTPDYGSLTVAIQLNYTVESLGILPPGAFYPPPSVASQALLLEPLPMKPDPMVEKVVRAAFAHRRKKLTSNIEEAFPGSCAESAVVDLGLLPTARPEELSTVQYVALTDALRKHLANAK